MILRIGDRMRKQAGIGLLELMLSLAIIAVLLIMATRYYQSTSQSQKVNQAAGDIQAILAAAANYGAGQPSAVFAIKDLKGFLPADWGDGNNVGVSVNPWGGNYTAANTAGDPTYVKITVTKMPETACEALSSLTKTNMVGSVAPTCSGGTLTATYGSEAGSSS